MPAPKRSTTASKAAPPGSTTWRAMRSVSTRAAPRSTSSPATVDLPAPIPPVSPMMSIGRTVLADRRRPGATAGGRADRRNLLTSHGEQADDRSTTGLRTPALDAGHDLDWPLDDPGPVRR